MINVIIMTLLVLGAFIISLKQITKTNKHSHA